MASASTIRNRPWLASGAVAAIIVAALLLIPISYAKTTGHDVALTLAGAQDDTQLRAIAGELKAALGVEQVMARVESNDNGGSVVLEAAVPTKNGVNAEAIVQAFANELRGRGYTASVVTTPHVEQISGSVYALARDLVIRVDTDGKSAAQIESEIRQRLAEAGITDAHVSVTDEASNQRKVTFDMQREGVKAGAPEPGEVKLEMLKDGKAIPEGNTVKVNAKKIKNEAGVVSLHLDIEASGKTVAVDVPNPDGMSDADLTEAIQAQLRQAGVDLLVTVTNGRMEIESRK